MFSISYFGYAAVLALFEKHVLFDPGIIRGEALVNSRNIQASYVLVSQATIEHLGNAQAFTKDQGSIILASKQVSDTLRRQGVLSYSVDQITHQNPITLGTNITVTGYDLPRGGFFAHQNFAFLVKSNQGSILHLGHAKEIGPLSKSKPDLLCVPIAGKKKGTFDPDEAMIATVDIQPRYVLPISGSESQINQFSSLLNEEEVNVVTISLSAGESFTLI